MTEHSARLDTGSVRMRWDVRIPMRDGIHLNGMLYLPGDAHVPAPAIVTLTPYTAQTNHERGLYFASRGYPFLSVDVRGRGNSEGVFAYSIHDPKDGHDVVEWLAQQPYCNGKVAMWGGSYAGHTQWAAAREMPAHLATIVPASSPFRGVDSPARQNIFSPERVQWLTLISGRTLQAQIFADDALWARGFRRWYESGRSLREADRMLGNPSPTFQEWLNHPTQDAYWDAMNPAAEHYARMRIPVLTITGIYDGNQPGALEHYRQHLRHSNAPHYLVMGPWDHAGTRTPKAEFLGLKLGPASLVDLGELHVQWYAWTLEGGPRPEFLRNRVAYYVLGAERWRYADTLEAITASARPYYLHSNGNPTDIFSPGSLEDAPRAQSEPDHYVYDPTDLSTASLESQVSPDHIVDQRMLRASVGKHLVYDSAPFVSDCEIAGFFKLSLWIAIDQPDTDFRVSIYEVGTDGGTLRLTTDVKRARYRESLREPSLVHTHDPQRYDFNGFAFVARSIRSGCRLRLVIGPIDSIYSEKNYNSGGVVADETMQDARTVRVKLFHDAAHPSALHVPFARPEDEEVSESA